MDYTSISTLHLIPSVGPGSFGLGPVALNLAREQIGLGCHSQIWSLDAREDADWAVRTSGIGEASVRTFRRSAPGSIGWSSELERAVIEDGQSFDILHQHGIWLAQSRSTVRWRRATSGPTIVTPHGSLQKWCFKRSRLKKALALLLYEKQNLESASCIHCVAESEISDCRNFGLNNPIAVIPNGISTAWLESVGSAEAFRSQFTLPSDRRIILFLSRITPIKGLPMLFQAISSLRSQLADWIVVIAGSDEFGHQREVETLVRQLNLDEVIKFVGPLLGESKTDAFSAASVFILPSYSEGAPIVILEALGAGVPVIATKASPWRELETYRCGWWPDIDTGSITESLSHAITLTEHELAEMGGRGRELVRRDYTWSRIAQRSVELYAWLLQRGPQPDFVVRG